MTPAAVRRTRILSLALVAATSVAAARAQEPLLSPSEIQQRLERLEVHIQVAAASGRPATTTDSVREELVALDRLLRDPRARSRDAERQWLLSVRLLARQQLGLETTSADLADAMPSAAAVGTGSFSGTVTDAATGNPIAGVTISILRLRCNGLMYFAQSAGSVTTDGQGAFSASGLEEGSYYAYTSNTAGYVNQIHGRFECPGYCTSARAATAGTPIVVSASQNTPGVSFALRQGGQVTGRVTSGATGAAVSGATVWINALAGTTYAAAVTDAAGVYTMRGLPSGRYQARATTASTDSLVDQAYSGWNCALQDVPCETKGQSIPVAAPGVTSSIDFALTAGGRISGRVTNASGDPLAQLQVRVLDADGDHNVSSTTDATGAYTSVPLLPGTYRLMTYPQQSTYVQELYDNIPCTPQAPCAPATGTPVVVQAGEVTTIDVALALGGSFTGVISSAGSGQPLVDGDITIYTASGSWAGSSTVLTDSTGAFTTYPGLPPGSYYLLASAPGHASKVSGNVTCSGCDFQVGTPAVVTGPGVVPNQNFSLDPGALVSGTIRDKATGTPVPGGVDFFSASGRAVLGGARTACGYGTFPAGAYSSTWAFAPGTYYAYAWPRLTSTGSSDVYRYELYSGRDCGTSYTGTCAGSITTGTPVVIGTSDVTGIDFDAVRAWRQPDLDYDRKADILWRHSGGALYIWLMDGTRVKASEYLPPISTAWQVQAVGDFNGDRYADILWRETSSGATYLWLMDAMRVARAGYTTSAADNSWTIEGTGDFNGDGKQDIVWRHSGGALYIWLMDGTTVLPASAYLPPISLAWQIKGVGDFNRDGQADILWRETSSGATYIWLMSGSAAVGAGYTTSAADNAWTIQGVGDLNGDGKSDTVWRHSGGALYLWLMDGTTVGPGSAYLPPISLAWQVQGVKDFDGDGRADLLWREATSGSTYTWLMNGVATKASGYTASQADNSWTIQAQR